MIAPAPAPGPPTPAAGSAGGTSVDSRRRGSAAAVHATALVATLVLSLPGCSSDAAPESATARATPTSASGGPPSTAPEGFPVHAVESRQQSRLRIIGGPDWLASDRNGVWGKRDSGEVDLTDPESEEGTASVEADPGKQPCPGTGAG